MSDLIEVTKYQFSELLADVNADYIDATKGDVDFALFIKNTLGLTMEAAFNALDVVSKSTIQFLFNKFMIQERGDSYMAVDYLTIPVSLKADLLTLKWIRLAYTRLLRVASKYGVLLADALNASPNVLRTRSNEVQASGSGTGNTRTTISPDNGGTIPPTAFQDWAITDNSSNSAQTEDATETETNAGKYNYEVLKEIIESKHDIMEYAELQLSALWDYNV